MNFQKTFVKMESIKIWMEVLSWDYLKMILRGAQQKINKFHIRINQSKWLTELKTTIGNLLESQKQSTVYSAVNQIVQK